MQIGQILVEQRLVASAALSRALAEQRHTGKRICSLLIARGLLGADQAVRALATQHNVPGVLQRHLENRDRALAALLPAAVAKSSFALPIGRTRDNELIVCVRDPRPELRELLAKETGSSVVIVVAPASQLEAMITETYQGRSSLPTSPNPPLRAEVSYDVDLSTRPIDTISDELIAEHARQLAAATRPRAPRPAPATTPAPAPAPPSDGDVEIDLNTRTIPVLNGELTDLGSMTLVELDDYRVARDPTQTGPIDAALPRQPTSTLLPRQSSSALRAHSPPMGSPALRGSSPALRPSSQLAAMRNQSAPLLRGLAPTDLDAALAVIDRASDAGDAADAAMRYVAARFRHAVLFAIHEGVALGDRGHGGPLTTEVIQAITVPLNAPSIVQLAHDTRRAQAAAPRHAGVIQDRLARTLGNPQALAAVPIEVDGRVAYVLAVGDVTDDPSTTPAARAELERLAGALAGTFQRLAPR